MYTYIHTYIASVEEMSSTRRLRLYQEKTTGHTIKKMQRTTPVCASGILLGSFGSHFLECLKGLCNILPETSSWQNSKYASWARHHSSRLHHFWGWTHHGLTNDHLCIAWIEIQSTHGLHGYSLASLHDCIYGVDSIHNLCKHVKLINPTLAELSPPWSATKTWNIDEPFGLHSGGISQVANEIIRLQFNSSLAWIWFEVVNDFKRCFADWKLALCRKNFDSVKSDGARSIFSSFHPASTALLGVGWCLSSSSWIVIPLGTNTEERLACTLVNMS